MNILIVGSNAREHALAKAIKQNSCSETELFCFGSHENPGIRKLVKDHAQGSLNDVKAPLRFALEHNIDLAIIGPEAPLNAGLSDAFRAQGIKAVGPTKNLASIETSKTFTRRLLKKYEINASCRFQAFENLDGLDQFVASFPNNGYVVKADGLMAGKGVKVAGEHMHSLSDAKEFCHEILATGQSFLIEEKLVGQEFSLMCFTDGKTLIPMPIVQDHKRAFENDEGPNTGGMGSYSCADHRLPFLHEDHVSQAMAINHRVLKALQRECEDDYQGILYGSFILTKEGVKLIEYNARFGDPECINVLSLLHGDVLGLFSSIAEQTLHKEHIKFLPKASVCKYAVAKGYPDNPRPNVIVDISHVKDDSQLYFAGLREDNRKFFTTGGRALAALGVAETLSEAEKYAEEVMSQVKGDIFYRRDIGTDALISRRVRHMNDILNTL